MKDLLASIKYYLKELFKNPAQRQQELNEKKRKMCQAAINANVYPKACDICAWAVNEMEA